MAQPEKASYRGKISPPKRQAKPNKMRPSHHSPVLSALTYANAPQAQIGYKLRASRCDIFLFLCSYCKRTWVQLKR